MTRFLIFATLFLLSGCGESVSTYKHQVALEDRVHDLEARVVVLEQAAREQRLKLNN